MSVKDEKHMATTEMRIVPWVIGVREMEKWGDLGGSKGGTNSDCHEKVGSGTLKEEMKQKTSEQLQK